MLCVVCCVALRCVCCAMLYCVALRCVVPCRFIPLLNYIDMSVNYYCHGIIFDLFTLNDFVKNFAFYRMK